MTNSCKIYYDNEYVIWEIPKQNIENTLIGSGGLLFLSVESAGSINFEDTSCKIDKNNDKLCDKKMTDKLKYKNGNNDSVLTPLSVVNFHTHPLQCYIDAETIWGWPSGEDLAQCLNFAEDNNLTHIIFAIEGTYVIDVNKKLLNYLLTEKKLYNTIKKNIEELFKITHKHRMYFNDSNNKILLEKEIEDYFMRPLNLPPRENIMMSWIYLINNLTIQNIYTLSSNFSSYFSKIKKINNYMNLPKQYDNMSLYHITFFKNNTIQWNNKLSKKDIFKELKSGNKSKNLKIELPNVIKYKAPFISEKCKL